MTSSALSHIFADIRLDAARLVSLLLQHVPSHVTAGWPTASISTSAGEASTTTSGSTILEGLRLALGLGGDKASSAQGRLTAGGKLVFLKAVLSFVGQALGRGAVSTEKAMWEGWLNEPSDSSSKADSIAIGTHGLTFDGTIEGWVVGNCGWGINTAAEAGWELGRLDGSSGSRAELRGDASSITVCSSNHNNSNAILNLNRIFSPNFTHYFYRHSLNLLHRPSPLLPHLHRLRHLPTFTSIYA